MNVQLANLSPSSAVGTTAESFDGALLDVLGAGAVSRPALRVAIWANGTLLPRYVRPLLRALRTADFIELIAVISAAPGAREAASPVSRDGSLLYRQYLRRFDAPACRELDPAAGADCADLLTGLPRLRTSAHSNPAGYRGDAEAVGALALDVIVCLGDDLPDDHLREVPRHGAWALHHGDSSLGYGEPPQMWELLERSGVTSVELVQLHVASAQPRVLERVDYSMALHSAVSKSRLAPYWGGAHLVLQRLRSLHAGVVPSRMATAPNPAPARASPRRGGPGNLRMARWLASCLSRAVVERIRLRGKTLHWRIALRRLEVPLLRQAGGAELQDFAWQSSPRGRFWADPFLFAGDGRTWLFFEEYDDALGRAGLSVAEVDGSGALGEVRPVLRLPHHLSYPHVFASEGAIFMIPESSAAGTVELWRAVDFPTTWRRETCLLRLRAVDSTVFEHGGRWWMFTSPLAGADHAAVTVLYSAPRLTGPWTLHRAGVICGDVRRARGAGAIVQCDGKLYRPAQDCGGGYGRALVFNEIVQLDEFGYAERPCRRIAPPGGAALRGVHTYSVAGGWEAIDARVLVPTAEVCQIICQPAGVQTI